MLCDHGEYFEVQPQRAPNVTTAFGRLGGHVVAFLANNSAYFSGQIDIDGALKAARFIRFANLYNIPVIFLEDTTGFLPGRDQESRGIVQAGRALLDSIIDLRVPRLLLIVRNAYGGAYATWNSYHVGADMCFSLPTARVAVMGPAGKEFVYKKELQAARKQYGAAAAAGDAQAQAALNELNAKLNAQYEKELMNPKEALSLGSISRIVMPGYSRQVLGENLHYLMRRYKAQPMGGVQREFH